MVVANDVIIVVSLCNGKNKTYKEKKNLVYNIFYVPIGVLEIFITQYYESCQSPEIKEQK